MNNPNLLAHVQIIREACEKRLQDSGQPTHHVIKCWPPFFDDVGDGRKTFELRRDDRGYKVRDSVELREYDPTLKAHTGRWLMFQISYVLRAKDAGPFGLLRRDACVIGIKPPANHTGVHAIEVANGDDECVCEPPIATEI